MSDVADGHERPEGASDDTFAAVGKVSEAFEYVERARGALFELHQLMGRADLLFGEAADDLESAGHTEVAASLREQVVGRNVLEGRWTFQVVEEFDDTYYEFFRSVERESRELTGGVRHLYEARMKEERRTRGHRDHTADPQGPDDQG
jgi:hypothetical protein